MDRDEDMKTGGGTEPTGEAKAFQTKEPTGEAEALQTKEPTMGRKLAGLFFSMLYISAFTFGGGFVIVTFMKRKFVDQLHWIDEKEMLDMTALAQSSPGAIAVNAAILVGWKVAGFPGMMAAVLGTVIPPIAILSVISLFYERFAANRYVALVLKGMSCGVAAVILDVSVDLGLKALKERRAMNAVIMAAAFAAVFFLNVNVIWIILAAAAVGAATAFAARRRPAVSGSSDGEGGADA